MKNKPKILEDYEVFGTPDECDNGKALKRLSEKETEENLKLFARRIGSDWKAADSGGSPRILSFSDFERAIAHKKDDIAEFLKKERDARKGNK